MPTAGGRRSKSRQNSLEACDTRGFDRGGLDMADRSLRNKWLLDAEDAAPDDVDAQIEWLREQRKTYSVSISAGDWATESATGEAGSSSSKRGVSDRANHDAIVDAIRHLGGTELGGAGALLQPQFSPGVG